MERTSAMGPLQLALIKKQLDRIVETVALIRL